MNKIHLGKTATSRTRRKKVIEEVSSKTKLPQSLSRPGGNDFMNYLLRKGYSNTTTESFYDDVRKFKAWLIKENIEIENVNYNDLTSYLQSFGSITQKTKGCYIRGVKQYFNFLIQQNERTDNPAEFIQLKGLKRKTLYDILNRKELDSLYHNYKSPDEGNKDKNQNWFKTKVLAQKRNKVVLGLMLYQALDCRDLKLLTVDDVKLREGFLFIPGTRKSDERKLKLESLQIMDIMDYLLTIRKELLQLTNKESEQLFISIGTSDRFNNIMVYLMEHLQKINPKVTSAKQLKASVIVHWLKLYNLRQVQYMAGHRYVSSTEGFLVNEMDGMIEDIEKYHPMH
jgi:site-specific recombinase XerD